MSESQTPVSAMFAVDCNGRLAIDSGDSKLALEAADVIRMMDFLAAITYKGLVKRTDCAGTNLAGASS